MIELSALGLFVGLLSGFFGIGGGTILVPLLMLYGFETKIAVGISVIQMIFSSVFGSYINLKKGTLDISMVVFIGIGGFIGALFSGVISKNLSDLTIEMIFLSFAIFALARVFFTPKEHKDEKVIHNYILLLIGVPLGAICMTIGVGGSIILVPILVGFLHVELKKAISAGLFFVVFSSIAGFISHAKVGGLDYASGITVGVASLIGVYIGIHFKDRVQSHIQRKLLITFYLCIVSYLSYKIFLV